MSARCDVFVRSYWKDLEWLELCLASIERYCRGFGDVIVVLPASSRSHLRRTSLAGLANVVYCGDFADDYLGQQVTKLHADTMTDAELICHVDSDCLFTRPTNPGDLLAGSRPRIRHRPYSLLDRHHPWRRPTERFLGWEVTDDYMQHPPFVYPRWLYPGVRDHCRALHGVDLETYVTSQPPRQFSEFNVLGAFAWRYHHSQFAWSDESSETPAGEVCRWYWSWGGLDQATRAEALAILGTDRP